MAGGEELVSGRARHPLTTLLYVDIRNNKTNSLALYNFRDYFGTSIQSKDCHRTFD